MSINLRPSSYLKLPERFYEKLAPAFVKTPQLLYWNADLAKELGVDETVSVEEKAQIFSGKKVLPETTPIAQAYAGHQFGHFSPQLGDGRARLLGELVDSKQKAREVHLKGSGPTKFSRRGDGLATLDSTLREVMISEAMNAFGIPTTRALAVIGTGDVVYREREFPGAILARIGASHVRVGTFEYFAARGDLEALQLLTTEVIRQNEIPTENGITPAIALYEYILQRQASLVAHWMRVGFIHGVMNTDNTAISGETIDFGPCAFMEAYDPRAVFSSIDHGGRYAYSQQPIILQWNLGVLGYCLLPLFADEKEAAEKILEQKLSQFTELFHQEWLKVMSQKLGFKGASEDDQKLIEDYLSLLHKFKADFTLGFRNLRFEVSDLAKNSAPSLSRAVTEAFFLQPETKHWLSRWSKRLQQEPQDGNQCVGSMDLHNPIVIPRNHQVEKAIRAASDNKDLAPMERLLKALKNPFDEKEDFADLQIPAKPEEQVRETFCGT